MFHFESSFSYFSLLYVGANFGADFGADFGTYFDADFGANTVPISVPILVLTILFHYIFRWQPSVRIYSDFFLPMLLLFQTPLA